MESVKGKLGFGCMRLPLTNPGDATSIDYDTFCRMADRFLAAGFNYFDTANPYHNGGKSETAFGECVAKRHPRESFVLANKLSLFVVNKADELEGFFEGQLERCGVEYFDYYLMHSMNQANIELGEKIGAFDFAMKKKAEGKVKHVGFSFHDTADVLEDLLTRHPELEFAQLQMNYVDWESEDVQSRACYEVARAHNVPIVVMEPVKGGLLTSIPDEAKEMLREADPDRSLASWAMRFTASLPGVEMVLSGMTDEAQMEDNLATMMDFEPLDDADIALLERVTETILSKETIACTNCRYCVDDCPKKIGIPDDFKLLNDVSKYGEGHIPRAKMPYDYYTSVGGMGKASDCIKCGLCEERCPQHLPIREYLEQVAAVFE